MKKKFSILGVNHLLSINVFHFYRMQFKLGRL